MSQRVNLRISYGNGLDLAPGERLGTDADGNELYRVWRNSIRRGEPKRDDVLRIRRLNEYAFEFVGSADPARPGTAHATIPRASVGTPAYDAFHRKLEESGCVVENDWDSGRARHVVITHPNDVPVSEWFEQLLRETLDIGPADLPEYLFNEQRKSERERSRRRTRGGFVRAASRIARLVVSTAVGIATVGVAVAIVVGGATMLVRADSAERPRIAAMAMLAALGASLLTRDGRKTWPLFIGCAAVALGALALLDSPAPSYGAVSLLGVLYALAIGLFGIVIAFFSGFASSSRELGSVLFGIVFPALASAIAAAVLAMTSAVAAMGR